MSTPVLGVLESFPKSYEELGTISKNKWTLVTPCTRNCPLSAGTQRIWSELSSPDTEALQAEFEDED
jgi:hypothetical protein